MSNKTFRYSEQQDELLLCFMRIAYIDSKGLLTIETIVRKGSELIDDLQAEIDAKNWSPFVKRLQLAALAVGLAQEAAKICKVPLPESVLELHKRVCTWLPIFAENYSEIDVATQMPAAVDDREAVVAYNAVETFRRVTLALVDAAQRQG